MNGDDPSTKSQMIETYIQLSCKLIRILFTYNSEVIVLECIKSWRDKMVYIS